LACLNNPHWRQVLKSWVRYGIAQGVDGFIANYFYRHDCHCPHCVAGFRQYLRERFTAAELTRRFGMVTWTPMSSLKSWAGMIQPEQRRSDAKCCAFANRQQKSVR